MKCKHRAAEVSRPYLNEADQGLLGEKVLLLIVIAP